MNPYNNNSSQSKGPAPILEDDHQDEDNDSSNSDSSDMEQLLVEGEVQYNSDEYHLETLILF